MKQPQTILLFSLILLMPVVFQQCNRAAKRQEQDLEFRFNRGKEQFQKEHYYKAIEDFNFVVLNNPGGERADDAQMFVADSHFELDEFVVAASEYRRLIRRYPESPLVEQAQYKLGMCFVELSPHYALDQEYTRKAINTLQNFLEDFPQSQYKGEITAQIDKLREKLSHKLYSNGHLYFILRQYDSANIYYDQLLDQFYDTTWSMLARMERAKALIKLGKTEEARLQLEGLLSRDPGEDIRSEAVQLLENLHSEPQTLSRSQTQE